MGVKKWGENVIPWRWASSSFIVSSTIAIDVPNYLTRRLAVVHAKKKNEGRLPLSHVGLFLSLVKSTLSNHILPVFIFDGPPESRKRAPNPELVRKASNFYRLFKQEGNPFNEYLSTELWRSPALRLYFAAEHLRDLCCSTGIPTLTAPSEAEMLAAALCRDGIAKTIVSNDADALLFGSPHVTKRMQLSSGKILCVNSTEFGKELGLDIELLRDLAVVSGCDFHETGVKGIGVRRGAVLLQRYRGLEGLLKAQGYSYTERKEFIEAREVFDEANYISTREFDITLKPPLVSRVLNSLEIMMSSEQAVATTDMIVSLWRDFGNRQSTLIQWL